MAFPTLSALSPISPIPAALRLLGSLAQPLKTVFPELEMPPGESVSPTTAGSSLLTPEMLRTTLLTLGMAADAGEVTLAGAMSRMGLPLTAASLLEAHTALAQTPDATPLAYALAKSFSLPPTSETLRALTAVTENPEINLPAGVMARIGLDARDHPAALAGEIRRIAAQTGQRAGDLNGLQKTLIRVGAGALATHLAGQQMINQAAQNQQATQTGHNAPLYLAIPCQFAGGQSVVEMQFWQPEPRVREEAEETEAAPLRVIVRVSPPKLGRVQAELTGRLSGSLTCRLGMEKASATRLLTRHTGALAASLSASGWPSCDVVCRQQTEWLPLWPGGEAAATPRTRVDWRI